MSQKSSDGNSGGSTGEERGGCGALVAADSDLRKRLVPREPGMATSLRCNTLYGLPDCPKMEEWKILI